MPDFVNYAALSKGPKINTFPTNIFGKTGDFVNKWYIFPQILSPAGVDCP